MRNNNCLSVGYRYLWRHDINSMTYIASHSLICIISIFWVCDPLLYTFSIWPCCRYKGAFTATFKENFLRIHYFLFRLKWGLLILSFYHLLRFISTMEFYSATNNANIIDYLCSLVLLLSFCALL